MKTATADLDELDQRLIRPGVAVVEVPALLLARMVSDLRDAQEAERRRIERTEEWVGGE